MAGCIVVYTHVFILIINRMCVYILITGISVVLDELHHFSSWRVFLVVCSLPAFAAVLGLYYMPESPRYLLEQGRDVEAIMVYKVAWAGA